jgi:hypothetical protein
LNVLGYLNNNYSGSYKIHGRSAEYYLTSKSRSVIKNSISNETSASELNQVYARPAASRRFINQSLAIFNIYLKLRHLFGEQLEFLTKPELNIESFDFLPKPLPDALFRLKTNNGPDRQFLLEYFDDAIPIGIHGRQIYKYMDYAANIGWPDSDNFPTIVIICESPSLLRRSEKRVRTLENLNYSELDFRLIDLVTLRTLENTEENAWIDPIEQSKKIL